MDSIDVGALSATLENVSLPMGLVVRRIIIEAADGVIDPQPFNVQLQKPARIEAHVEEGALAAFLEQQSPDGMKGFAVRAHAGRLFVNARIKVLFELSMDAVCTLRIVEGKQLFVDLESVDMAGVGAKTLAEQQLEKVNPVIDARDLPLDITLERVEIGDGEVVLFGTAVI